MMRMKLVYMAVVSVMTCCGLASGMDKSNQLTIKDVSPNTQMTSSSNTNQSVPPESVNFTNSSLQRFNCAVKLPDGSFLGVKVEAAYSGTNVMSLANYMKALENLTLNFNPNVSPVSQTSITDEDKINITNFAKYASENLFLCCVQHYQEITEPTFKTFRESDKAAFGSYKYKNNNHLFALMYYMEGDEGKDKNIEMKNKRENYNSQRFIFSPCPLSDKEKGTDIPFAFVKSSTLLDYQIMKQQPDTVKDVIFSGYNSSVDAQYTINCFKVGNNLYRLRIKLSSKENNYATSYTDRKVANILLTVAN